MSKYVRCPMDRYFLHIAATTAIVGMVIFATISFVVIFNSSNAVVDLPAETNILSGVVAIHVGPDSHGSGVIVARQGNWWYVATAAHVADTGLPMMIRGYEAEYVAVSVADVALVRFRDEDHEYTVSALGTPTLGMKCTAKGWLRNNADDELMLTHFRLRVVCEAFDGSVAFQGGVYWGMSGSGVFDDQGHVVGIISRATIAPWGEPWAGMSLFESADWVQQLLDENL